MSVIPNTDGGICEHCQRVRQVMVTMGAGATAWQLCTQCWIDGVKPKDAPPEKLPLEVSAPMADALRKSGWKTAGPDAKTRKQPRPKKVERA